MRSLYGKFLIFTIGIMLSSGILAFLVVNTYYHQQMKVDNDEKNMAIAENITQFIQSQAHLDLNKYLTTQADVGYKLILVNEQLETSFFGEEFRIDNLSSHVIQDVHNGIPYHGMRDLQKETFMTGFFSDETANTVGVPFTYQGQNYALFLRPDIKMLFNEIHYLLAGLFIGMALLSIVAMLFVARKLIQPISALTEATKKVGAEQFSVSLPIKRSDEIGQLATSFQEMAKQLKESDRVRKQFINDVSHDFQTPLQNIKGYAALLQDEQTTDLHRKEYSEIIQTETDRLSTLTKQLLLLTSLDSLSEQIEFETVHIDQQIKDVLHRYRWLMDEKSISLTVEMNAISIHANADYLEKIWENILANALKYSAPGETIFISVQENEQQAIVSFEDSGIGIEKENIPYLFDRFYRVDDARNDGIEGTGLGLAIVEQVVSLHNGKIEVDSIPDKGTTFTIYLPKHR